MNNNNFTISKFFGNNSDNFFKCLQIRKKVFIEEQNVPEEIEADEHDKNSHHYLLILNDKQLPIGTARWRITDKGIKLERFAILPEYRNKGYGQIILNEVLNDVLSFEKTIYLHAQESAVAFYLKNNFIIEGSLFIEANIKHYKMVYSP
jgi:predicted GNAT family N-acyltransferase